VSSKLIKATSIVWSSFSTNHLIPEGGDAVCEYSGLTGRIREQECDDSNRRDREYNTLY
jgi:hypothetical protein